MGNYCEDCGTVKLSGVCPNCYEELYINDYQISEFIGTEYEIKKSDEWSKKVDEQRIKNKEWEM